MGALLDFIGTDSEGKARSGRVATETPAQLAERLYRLRYRSATITEHSTGEVVGSVTRVEGRRTWWGTVS